jgi:hypothetical protein
MEKGVLSYVLDNSETEIMPLMTTFYNDIIASSEKYLIRDFKTLKQRYNTETNPMKKNLLANLAKDYVECKNVQNTQRASILRLKSKGVYQYLRDDFFQKLASAQNTDELIKVGRLSELLTIISGSESLDGRNFYGMELFDIKAFKLRQYAEDSTDGNDNVDGDFDENEDNLEYAFEIKNANAFKRKCLNALSTPVDQVSNEIQRLIHAYGDRESLNGEFADDTVSLLSANYEVLSTLTGDQLQAAKTIYKRIMKLLINCRSFDGYGKEVSDISSVLVGNPEAGVQGLLQVADLDDKVIQYRDKIKSNLSPSTTTGKFKPVKKPNYIGKKPALKKSALYKSALKQPTLKRPT